MRVSKKRFVFYLSLYSYLVGKYNINLHYNVVVFSYSSKKHNLKKTA